MPNWILNELVLKGDPRRIHEFLETTIPQPNTVEIGVEPGGADWVRIYDVKLNHRTVDLSFLRIRFETAASSPGSSERIVS